MLYSPERCQTIQNSHNPHCLNRFRSSNKLSRYSYFCLWNIPPSYFTLNKLIAVDLSFSTLCPHGRSSSFCLSNLCNMLNSFCSLFISRWSLPYVPFYVWIPFVFHPLPPPLQSWWRSGQQRCQLCPLCGTGSGLYSSMTGMVTAHWPHGTVHRLLRFTAYLLEIPKRRHSLPDLSDLLRLPSPFSLILVLLSWVHRLCSCS